MAHLFESTFYFLRHGQTTANVEGIVSGSLDVELTALGREQAQASARVLSAHPIAAIYCSPLRRARETAEPVARALHLPVTLVPELVERGRGAQEGRAPDVLATTAANEEPFEVFAQRVLRGLALIDGPSPLVVAHLGVFRVLCQALNVSYAKGPVANALPLLFTPVSAGNWTVEALS